MSFLHALALTLVAAGGFTSCVIAAIVIAADLRDDR